MIRALLAETAYALVITLLALVVIAYFGALGSTPDVTLRPAEASRPVSTPLAPEPPSQVAEQIWMPAPLPSLTPIELALARSPWPPELWPAVVEIARCESQHDKRAVGDQGRSLGLMQVHISAHPDLAASHNLLDEDGNLDAAWVIYVRAGYSFRPWSCAR